MEAKRPHLNPGFKVVFASIGMAEDAFLPATRGSPRAPPANPRLGAGFVFVLRALARVLSL